MEEKQEEEKVEEDQGGKGDGSASRARDRQGEIGGAESNRAELGFRSDRAAKTNPPRALCGRFVAMATIGDCRSPADRAVDQIHSIELLLDENYPGFCFTFGAKHRALPRRDIFLSKHVVLYIIVVKGGEA